MGDLFHEDVPTGLIIDIFGVITGADQHSFLILTKRPERMKSFMEYINRFRTTPLKNVWLGVTAENDRTADERIPILLDTPAAKRFVSVEPMLEDVNIFDYLLPKKTIWAAWLILLLPKAEPRELPSC